MQLETAILRTVVTLAIVATIIYIARQKKTTITWIGNPVMVVDETNVTRVMNIEFGLNSDNTILWRKQTNDFLPNSKTNKQTTTIITNK